MSFTSPFLVVFILVTILVYFNLQKFQWIVLLTASLAFYLTWGGNKFPFLMLDAWIAWAAGSLISLKYGELDRCLDQESKASDAEIKKYIKLYSRVITTVSVFFLLASLLYVKVGSLLRKSLSPDSNFSIIVPIGISYYTFSLIGYILDCYWRKEKPEKNYFKLLLFACYFPKVRKRQTIRL